MIHFSCDRCKRMIDPEDELRYVVKLEVSAAMEPLENCEVEGVIDGKVVVEELLSLRSMSKLYGEIKTGKLAIEPGATFTGKCDMGGKKEASIEPIAKPKEGQA